MPMLLIDYKNLSVLFLHVFDIVKNVTDFEFPNEHYAQNYAYVGTANQATEFAYYFNFDGKKISYKYKKQGFQSYIYEEIIINGEVVVLRQKDKIEILNFEKKKIMLFKK